MGLLSKLFARAPKYHESAYGDVYAAIVARLSRSGVRVGGTASYPRIEVHTITENPRLDKEGAVRQLSLTVESISNKSLSDAVSMNQENLALLTGEGIDIGSDWVCLGVIPDQLQDLTETAESAKILYRILQGFDIYVERIKN